MKAEKRKELHTNALADSIGRLITRLKEKPGQMSYMVWGAVILIAGTAIAFYYFSKERKKNNSARWEQLAEATTPEKLNEIIKNNKDTPAGRDARLRLAREYWAEGSPGLFGEDPKSSAARLGIGKTEATAKLTEAEKMFEELANEFSDVPVLAQECYLNAAKIQVSLGKYEEGVKLYRELAKKYPKSEMASQATELADDVEKNRAEIEKVIKQVTPTKPFEASPGSGGG